VTILNRSVPVAANAVRRGAGLALFSLVLSACGGGGGDAPTSISTNPGSLSYTLTNQAAAQTQNVTVNYKGSGVIIGYAPGVTPPQWLSIQTLGGATDSSGTVAMTVDAAGLNPGAYSTSVRFVTGLVPAGGGQNDATNIVYTDLPVTLTVVDLTVSTGAVSVQVPDGSSAAQSGSFALGIGSGTHWSASSNQPWLSVPASGTGPGNISYSINVVGLSLGTHTAIITITDGSGNSVTVTVTVTVSAPLLTSSPDGLIFNVGADTSQAALSLALTISDQLNGSSPAHALSWSVGQIDVPWLKMSPASGSSAPPEQISVSIPAQQLATMANGSYSGNITLDYTTEDGLPHVLTVPISLMLNSPLSSITLTPSNPDSVAGQAQPQAFTASGLNADGYSQDLTTQVNWSSSAPGVATISNTAPTAGQAQPLSPGKTTITATSGKLTGSTTLNVSAAVGAAYVVNVPEGNIAEYLLGDDGVLHLMAIPTVSAGSEPQDLVFTPSGKYAYVGDLDNNAQGQFDIRQYSVGASGALTPLANPAFSAPYPPLALTVDASGQHLYVAACCSNIDALLQFDIGADGSLRASANPQLAIGESPLSIAANPLAPYVYLTSFNDNTLLQYAIGSGGALTPLHNPTVAAGAQPDEVVIHPSGKYAYAVNFSYASVAPAPNGTVSQYNIGADGSLTPMSTPSVAAGIEPRRMAISNAGKFAYVINDTDYSLGTNSSISEYSIDATGGLHLVGTATPNALFGNELAVDPSDHYLYVTTGNATTVQFDIGADGTLTLTRNAVSSGTSPQVIVVRRPGH